MIKQEFSAGGVVVKRGTKQNDTQNNAQDIRILVGQHSYHHGWVFPKGLIGDHIQEESKEETALREVQEETGVVGKILDPLEPVTYFYVWNEEKIKKTVYYYVMAFVSEDPSVRDQEMEKVAWLPVDEVEDRLTYESDRKVWREAREKINKFEIRSTKSETNSKF